MLTEAGCQRRIQRVLEFLKQYEETWVLSNPIHLRYFANFHVEPFALGADFGGLLVIKPDGTTILVHDNKMPESVKRAYATQKVVVPWYDGQSPQKMPRRLALETVAAEYQFQLHDYPTDHYGSAITGIIEQLRRQKDADELDLLRYCMRVGEAGHAWARANIAPGMTELDVYQGVMNACSQYAGRPVCVYGDFAVSPGMARRGGPPTTKVLQAGDTFILDYSAIIQGYRSDFTNTLCVGKQPTNEQQRLFDLCREAMKAGERTLRPGVPCQEVYDAVRGVFAAAGLADHFPHHAGHGLGISHPEPPYLVRQSTEILRENDVITLEPGLYVDGVGGIRIEHNYCITQDGFERLSDHAISLV